MMENQKPSKELWLEIRKGFIQKERKLTAWCEGNKVNYSNLRKYCVTGGGLKADYWREKVIGSLSK